MSNDILERLRAAHPGSMQIVVGSKILAEAADEIERLRVALKCERTSGTCAMVHDPERAPCTADNCNSMRANQQNGPRDGS
jgi:hypothetical protein